MTLSQRLLQMKDGYEFTVGVSVYGWGRIKKEFYRQVGEHYEFFQENTPEFTIMCQKIDYKYCY